MAEPRRCGACDAELPITADKRRRYCDQLCANKARWKRSAATSLDSSRAVHQQWLSENPDKMMFYRARYRAKSLGIPFSIAIDDIHVPARCPVLNIRLRWNLGSGKRGFHPNSPSLDRIRPSLGYVPGNVRVISCRANLLKSDASIDELELVLADLKKIWQ